MVALWAVSCALPYCQTVAWADGVKPVRLNCPVRLVPGFLLMMSCHDFFWLGIVNSA